MFAKRLKAVGNDVTLDILEGLPHGFLNFSLVCYSIHFLDSYIIRFDFKISKEAHEGSKVCIERMKELLNFNKDEFLRSK